MFLEDKVNNIYRNDKIINFVNSQIEVNLSMRFGLFYSHLAHRDEILANINQQQKYMEV